MDEPDAIPEELTDVDLELPEVGAEWVDVDEELVEIERGLVEWLLLDGNRVLVAGLIAAGFFGLFALAEVAGIVPLRDVQPSFYLFGGLVGGNLTLITVVVSINQLLLSREFDTPGELRSQMDGVIAFRSGVEEAAGRIAPVGPMGFLRLLLENTRKQVQRIGGLADSDADGDVEEAIDELVTTLTKHFDEVDALLHESGTGTFAVLSSTLSTNYAGQINRVRRIRAQYGEDLDEAVDRELDSLIARLQEIDVARQYFKSIYLRQELSSLTRLLLYAGLPAEAVTALVLLSLTGDPAAFSRFELAVAVPVALAVGFLPLAILASFILRTATVTKRTAATVPFTTPEQEG